MQPRVQGGDRVAQRELNRRRSRAPSWGSVRRVAATLAAALALVGVARDGRAQARTFYLDRLQLGGGPDDAVALWRPELARATRLYGQLGLGLAYDPFRLENHVEDPARRAQAAERIGAPVQLQLQLYATLGVELADRVALQVQLPAALVQLGRPTGDASTGLSDVVSMAKSAMMDTRVDARVVAYRDEARRYKLGFSGSLFLPSGAERSFGGDGGVSGALGAAFEVDLRTAVLLLNTGVHFRPRAALNDFSLQHEWRYGAGALFPLRGGAARLGVELFGSVGLGPAGAYRAPLAPLEWLGEARFAMDDRRRSYVGFGGGTRLTTGYAPDFRALVFVGYAHTFGEVAAAVTPRRFTAERYAEHIKDTDSDGLADDVDLCPTEREDHKPPNADDGCPAQPDADGDGIPDVEDACPKEPEDFDSIDDLDGCPETDADADGVPDPVDVCPDEPGVASSAPGKNGCPQHIRRVRGSTEIRVLSEIQFETGKAKLLPASYPILIEVAQLLATNPEIAVLGVEGHTDSVGSDEQNERLSKARAEAVARYLEGRGVARERLAPLGYGSRRPLADNQTSLGRQRNRRVEFHIRPKASGEAAAP